jgi:putative component of toxin-antitoxin plasmid stabilization module
MAAAIISAVSDTGFSGGDKRRQQRDIKRAQTLAETI